MSQIFRIDLHAQLITADKQSTRKDNASDAYPYICFGQRRSCFVRR